MTNEEAAARLVATRAKQRLPAHVEDATALARIADVLRETPNSAMDSPWTRDGKPVPKPPRNMHSFMATVDTDGCLVTVFYNGEWVGRFDSEGAAKDWLRSRLRSHPEAEDLIAIGFTVGADATKAGRAHG
jgi:hypothetical protein